MVKKKWLFFLAVASLVFVAVAVKAGNVTASNVQVYVNQTGSIGFQHSTSRYLTVTVTAGFINSSVNQLRLHDAGGYFKWTNLNTTTFRVSFSDQIDTIQVAGDGGHELRQIASGNTFNAVTGDRIEIIWGFGIDPLLPVLFIMGMVGIVSTISGPTYAIYLLKKGQYRNGMIQGIVYTAIGIGLVLGWLWGVSA